MSEVSKVQIVNPLLERAKMPGESFTLPSLGLFYNNGELSIDVVGGEIYISPMVTLDEIILKSPDKLYSGMAINEVFKRCIPQILKPMELLAKDVDFILTALFKLSFGNTTEISYQHDCDKSKTHKYSLDMNGFIRNTVKMDPTTSGQYTTTLSNGQVLEVSPPRFLPALKIYQTALNESDISDEDLAGDILTNISSMIENVDDINDKGMIIDWLAVLNPKIIKEITDIMDKNSSWGTDFGTTIICKDCGTKVDVTSNINPISFFFEN